MAWPKIIDIGGIKVLHFVHYNFVRVHKTLRVTPAMQAGLATHIWSLEEMIELLDRANAVAA